MWFFARRRRSWSTEKEWISREVTFEGQAVLARVNLAARSTMGNPRYSHYLRVSVPFHDADANGLPTAAECLDSVEAILERALEAEGQALHVATTTLRNVRDYVFYTQDMVASFGRLAEAMDDSIEREVRAEAKPDPDWKFYASLAF